MNKTAFVLGFLPNPRMYKRIALAKSFSEVHLICWDRGREMLEKPNISDVDTCIIQIDAGNDPISRLVPFKKFKKQTLVYLKKIKPNIIHVQGLDMLQIAWFYKNHVDKSARIIYEVADLHRLLVDEQRGLVRKIAQRYLRHVDKKYCKQIDLLIVTSPKYFDSYFQSFVPKDKVFFFPNVPDLSAFEMFKKKTNNKFTIGYFGVIRYKNELKLLINSLDNDMHLIIAGYEESGDEIEQLCKNNSSITWYGRFNFKEKAAELYSQCDCIYAVYDASMQNCQVAIPNKLYEAVYCRLPILVADNTYVGNIVREWNVGIPVKHDSRNEIKEALNLLKLNDKYAEFVNGCTKHESDVDLNRYNNELKTTINYLLKQTERGHEND